MSNKKRNRLARLHQQQQVQQHPPKSVQARQLRELRTTQIAARVTMGPIPSADELANYAHVQPDLPERIMRQYERRTEMAEAQARHRMAMESKVVDNNIKMERRGWGSGTGLGLFVMAGSMWLVHEGHSVAGLAGVIASLATLVGIYVWGRHDQIQNIAKKRAAEMLKTGVNPSEQLDLLPAPKE
jgi:uncharacterized membrane protein